MKKIVTKAKWIDRTMVRTHYKIAICTSEEDFKFELKRLNVPEKDWNDWLEGDADAMTHTFDGVNKGKPEKIIIVCIRKDNKDFVSFLIHEAVHIYQFEINFINEVNPSDEFMCYSIQEIATNLIKAFAGDKTRRKK